MILATALTRANTIPTAVQQPIPPLSLSGIDSSQAMGANVPEYVVLKPSDEVTFSSETTASVAVVNVKEGDHFLKNDILMQLDCRIQQADLDKAEAQLKLSNVGIESAKKLLAFDSISNYELAQATAQSEQANADVSKLRAIVEKCTIKAPFDGSVATLFVHADETVKPADPLLKIVSTNNLDVEMQVPSNWLKWLRVDSTFYIHVNEINKTVPAKIVRINPEIDSISQTIKITGKINLVDNALLPGMSGQAHFPDNPDDKSTGKPHKI